MPDRQRLQHFQVGGERKSERAREPTLQPRSIRSVPEVDVTVGPSRAEGAELLVEADRVHRVHLRRLGRIRARRRLFTVALEGEGLGLVLVRRQVVCKSGRSWVSRDQRKRCTG